MAILKNKGLMFGFAILFAMLQVLQPFIHAHLDADHPVHSSGFHVGAVDELYFSAPSTYGVYFAPHAAHIVSVDQAIKQEADTFLNFNSLDLALLIIVISILLILAKPSFSQAKAFQYQSLRRYRPATRAPPQF